MDTKRTIDDSFNAKEFERLIEKGRYNKARKVALNANRWLDDDAVGASALFKSISEVFFMYDCPSFGRQFIQIAANRKI